jgi:hypothetical protein
MQEGREWNEHEVAVVLLLLLLLLLCCCCCVVVVVQVIDGRSHALHALRL